MRRLFSVLAAGVLAAGTVLTATGAASADPAAARQVTCGPQPYFWVTVGGVNYYLGTPNKLSSGAAAILKPNENDTTAWEVCHSPDTWPYLENRGLALTSRSSSPGADVTLEPPGNGGLGFASQQWEGDGSTFYNVKTGLFLRIRNGGPVIGQTLTTGITRTNWNHSAPPG